GHSSCHFPRTAGKREGLRNRILAHLDGRQFKHDSFFHIYIFPNLFISSQEGLTFYIGQALPDSADHTLLRTRMYEPQIALSEKERTRQDVMNTQSVEIGNAVIAEDRVILEHIQRAIPVTTSCGTLGDMERRISAFHLRYEQTLGLHQGA
ncbi:MAG: Rieske (2Fe-2S) protein, partial [Oxalobacteraceae bacterium]